VKKQLFLALSGLVFLSPLVFSQKQIRKEELAQKYQDWLKLTAYIILPQEKEVFFKLDNDRDRDIFLESFWKQRDPTPGTPQNEYQDEIIQRFNYANKEFRKGTSREGWMTDMGQYYIILGPPISRERFDTQRDTRPCEVWSYYGDVRKGLPPNFSLVFFKRSGVGEFKLYNPLSDGPASLLMNVSAASVSDNQSAYEKLQEAAPTLAPFSLSLIPGYIPYAYGFQASLQSDIILADILNSPKKNINPSYAGHFLNFKGVVSTEYLTNFVESESIIALLPDPVLGINFLHYSVSPKKISIDYYADKDQYFCNYSVDVSLRRGEKIFYQYSKEFPFYFPPAEEQAVKDNGISIQDSFPVIDGKYQLIILLKNTVGKEFSTVEKDITCLETPETPRISEALLGYKLMGSQNEVRMPFQVSKKKLMVDPKNVFSASDDIAALVSLSNVPPDIWRDGKMEVAIQGLKENSPSQKAFLLELSEEVFHQNLTIARSFPAAELVPDYYEIKFILLDDRAKAIDEKNANFILIPGPAVARPFTIFKTFPVANSYFYFHILAGQCEKSGDAEKAESFYQKSYEMAPDFKEGIVYYANFLIRNARYEKALALAENIASEEELNFDYHLIKGRALTHLGRYVQAIDQLLEANKIYDSDTRLLNALGLCFYKTGEKDRAIAVLKASLSLNPDQPDIKRLLEEIQNSSRGMVKPLL